MQPLTNPVEPRAHFPANGLVRLNQILAPDGPLPISRSTWWAGVASGRYPAALKLGPRITVWKAQDVLELLETGASETGHD